MRSAALDIFLNESYAHGALARTTVAVLEAHAEPQEFWMGDDCEATLLTRLANPNTESLTRSILSIAGGFWIHGERASPARSQRIYEFLETTLFDTRRTVSEAAAWTWAFWRHIQGRLDRKKPIPSNTTLAQLVARFLDGIHSIVIAIGELSGVGRGQCTMALTTEQEGALRYHFADSTENDITFRFAVLRIAFILKGVFSDAEIRDFITRNEFARFEQEENQDIFEVLGIGSAARKKKRPDHADTASRSVSITTQE